MGLLDWLPLNSLRRLLANLGLLDLRARIAFLGLDNAGKSTLMQVYSLAAARCVFCHRKT